jgi:hypothetical protein
MSKERGIGFVPTVGSKKEEEKEPQVVLETPPPNVVNNYLSQTPPSEVNVSVVNDFRPLVEAVLLLVILLAVIQLVALSSRA